MLVLTREKNESIMIGDDIEIVIVGVRRDKVRLGIRAPGTIAVHRKEVYLAIQQANIEAAQAEPGPLDQIGKMMPGVPPGSVPGTAPGGARTPPIAKPPGDPGKPKAPPPGKAPAGPA